MCAAISSKKIPSLNQTLTSAKTFEELIVSSQNLKSDNTYTAIDLFCGAGGLTAGLQQAGFKVISAIEVLPLAAETYSKNHPEVHMVSIDIKKVNPIELMKTLGIKKGELDLVAGCPPCQGFSSLRTRNKSSSVFDARNDLVIEFLRFVEAFLPKTVMMENVPALAKDGRINTVLESLKNLGYHVDDKTVQVQDASDFGVPQRRRRMILLASRNGNIPETKKISPKTTVRKFITSVTPEKLATDPLHNYLSKRTEKINELIRHIPKDGGSRMELPESMWLECHKRYPKGFRDVYGRMKWDDVSPTMTGGCINPSKGRFLHPEENRAITLREAALLQTFPSDYYFPHEAGRDKVALMIGNALPPEFIRRHALSILEHLNSNQISKK